MKFCTMSSLLEASILLILLMIPESLQPVFAIKCYVCQSNVDPKCADPFDNQTLPITDCDAYARADLATRLEQEIVEDRGFAASLFFGQSSSTIKPLMATMCRKIRQKVNGEWRTIRGCGYLGGPSAGESQDESELRCKVRHGTHDIFTEACTCNSKDGCNGSLGMRDRQQTALLLALSTISIVFLSGLILKLEATM